MKFKIVKYLGWSHKVEYSLYYWGETGVGGPLTLGLKGPHTMGWVFISSGKTEQEMEDFAKQYQAVREEKEFTL